MIPIPSNKSGVICAASLDNGTGTTCEFDIGPLSCEDLQVIDAIEASYFSSPAHAQVDYPKTPTARRELPNSIVQLPDNFSLTRCRGAVKERYPEITFRGRIVYCRTESEVEEAARELSLFLKSRLGEAVVGFDLEWKPSFQSDVLPGKAAVLQLCADMRVCYVMHIIHSSISSTLRVLLEDPSILKVGVAINNDCVKLFKDHDVSVQCVEDLSSLANKIYGGEGRYWSLQHLTEKHFFRELPKPHNIRMGNWEVDVLNNEQLRYAATDAFISLQLYLMLKSLLVLQKTAVS